MKILSGILIVAKGNEEVLKELTYLTNEPVVCPKCWDLEESKGCSFCKGKGTVDLHEGAKKLLEEIRKFKEKYTPEDLEKIEQEIEKLWEEIDNIRF